MNLNVPTKTARLTCGTRRSYQSMNHMIRNVSSVIARCKRFTQYLISNSKVKDSIQQIQEIRHAVLTCGYSNWFDNSGTLTARALKGSERAASRIARSVAIVIGIALSIPMQVADGGSINAIQTVHELADIQLTEKQEYCHDRITFLESSNNKLANNGSHWGYYQGRSKALKGAPDDYQFYWYWHYVQHRYGVTRYDEPNYCKALHHLRVKGWQ
jgi:hypothetical protein